jgi:hypothetical protein
MGIVKWVDTQLDMPMKENIYTIKTIQIAKNFAPNENDDTIDDYLADNDVVFNKNVGSFNSPRYRLGAWFDIAVNAQDQLRHKIAYILSQIIVESDSNEVFIRRGEALSNYFDILYKNAFNNYYKLLEDISLSAGMGVYLTYVGNKKEYISGNTTIYPDENYAREIMQLFSIGLFELNLDGTPKLDENGKKIPTYTQKDIMELSKVFTGLDLQRNAAFGYIAPRQGDYLHNLECVSKYHDYREKHILGKTIPSDLNCIDDIKYAISILNSNPNIAPFISKKLIKRLVKSNPSKEYVKRVATVFRDTNGNLKKVVRAILLDREFWDDLKNAKWEKFKEPLIAYTQFLRAFYAKPYPFFYHCHHDTNCSKISGSWWINDPFSYLNQGPAKAKTVFGFYNDDFIPESDYFKEHNLTAPELKIETDSQIIEFSNKIYDNLFYSKEALLSREFDVNDTKVQYKTLDNLIDDTFNIGWIANKFRYIGSDKFYVTMKDEYKVLELAIDGDSNGDFKNLVDCKENKNLEAIKKLIDFEDKKLTGGQLTDKEKEIILNSVGECIYKSSYDKKQYLYKYVISPIIRIIVGSEKYMRE